MRVTEVVQRAGNGLAEEHLQQEIERRNEIAREEILGLLKFSREGCAGMPGSLVMKDRVEVARVFPREGQEQIVQSGQSNSLNG